MTGQGTLAARRPFWRFQPEDEWRRNLYALMVAVFVSFTGFTFVMPFLPLYITRLGVSDPGQAALWSGFLFGVSPLIAGLLAPVWAIVGERYGRKAMMQRSLGAFIFLLAGMAFVTNVYQLLALRLLIGVFGGFGALSVALASGLAPRHRIGEAVGLVQATQLASGIGAPFLGGLVADTVGLKNSFFVAAALCLAGFLLITFSYREERAESGSSAAQRRRGGSVRDYLNLPVFVGLLVAIFTIQFIDRSFGPLLPLYIATLGAPAERLGSITGLVMTLGALAGSIAAVWAGRLSSRRPPRPLLLGSLVAGALLCLPIAFVGHWGQLLVLRALLGLLAGGSLTLAYAVGGRQLPPEAKVGAFGTLAGAGMIGGAISPLVTGVLSRYATLSTIFVVDAVLYLLVLGWSWAMLAPRAEPAPVPATAHAGVTQTVLAESPLPADRD